MKKTFFITFVILVLGGVYLGKKLSSSNNPSNASSANTQRTLGTDNNSSANASSNTSSSNTQPSNSTRKTRTS